MPTKVKIDGKKFTLSYSVETSPLYYYDDCNDVYTISFIVPVENVKKLHMPNWIDTAEFITQQRILQFKNAQVYQKTFGDKVVFDIVADTFITKRSKNA